MSTSHPRSTRRAAGEPTQSYEPGDVQRGSQANFALLGRPPRAPGDASRELLRNRLRYIGLAITGLWVFVTFVWLSSLLQETSHVRESLLWMARDWTVFVVAVVLTGILWTRYPLSLERLRWIEVALFGLVLGNQTWDLYDQLFVQRQLASLLQEPAESSALIDYFHSWALVFVMMIVSYGTLVPSTWRRCTVIVGVMAFTPVVLFASAGFFAGVMLTSALGTALTELVIWLLMASGIAIFGAHRIEVLRQEAFAARKLGQYELKQCLGAGGMGEVYLAQHALLRRPCAIKLIRPERARNPQDMRRFEREVQATATLTHPNTVQVFDYGHAEDGTFYYVMEYLPGVTLEQLVQQQGPLPAQRAVHLIRQVCGALREAHAIGLIHRDVKPSNVMVCERGGQPDTVKLLDFGLVLPHTGTSDNKDLTREATLAGTPAYMSPEQAANQEGIDARSDVYSVGALAYFLLTGEPPFADRSSVQLLAAHLHELPAPLTQHRLDIPADLQTVVLRCLAKDPVKRYADAESLEAALANCATMAPE